MCVIGLIIFQDSIALHYLMSTLFFKKKKFFWVYSTQITLKVFHVNHVSYVTAMLDFFLVKPCVDIQL